MTDAPSNARRKILHWLKYKGPQDASVLARHLKVSPMAIRQHLYALRDEKFVEYELQSRSKGRPAKLWKLAIDANRFFPDGHSDLVVDLLSSVRGTFGEKGMQAFLAARTRTQIDSYIQQVPQTASLRRRLEALSEIRTGEGYMAEIVEAPKGSFLFIENHCSICAAATSCSGLCNSELEIFRSVLGPDVTLERLEHIMAGDRRCVYQVSPLASAATRKRKAPKRRL